MAAMGKWGQEHVDIITFYNEVSVPSVKPLLVEVSLMGLFRETISLPKRGKILMAKFLGHLSYILSHLSHICLRRKFRLLIMFMFHLCGNLRSLEIS